jgi:hypothetical protein
MQDYILAIYQEPLNQNDLREMERLCPDLKIEKIPSEDSEALGAGYCNNLKSLDVGYSYRFYHEPETLTFLFIRYPPKYIGQFTIDEEQKCISIYHHCVDLLEQHDQVYAVISEYDFEQEEFLRLIETDSDIDPDERYGPTWILDQYAELGKEALQKIYQNKKIGMPQS